MNCLYIINSDIIFKLLVELHERECTVEFYMKEPF